MTTMLIARHGQSEWNALGRWQGQADPPLSDLGRQQAYSASRRIGAVDLIVSSDLQRAMETAQIISGQIGVGPVVVEPRLRERDAGPWSGLTKDEIDVQYPGFLENDHRPAGYEPDDLLLARTTTALHELHSTYAGAEILVIAHGGVVYAIERDQGFVHERLPNLGARWIDHLGDRLVLGERVLLVGDDEITTVPAQI